MICELLCGLAVFGIRVGQLVTGTMNWSATLFVCLCVCWFKCSSHPTPLPVELIHACAVSHFVRSSTGVPVCLSHHTSMAAVDLHTVQCLCVHKLQLICVCAVVVFCALLNIPFCHLCCVCLLSLSVLCVYVCSLHADPHCSTVLAWTVCLLLLHVSSLSARIYPSASSSPLPSLRCSHSH